MTQYTLGFIFNGTLDKVLLMYKQKPEWQKGKLNGVGGKMEAGETETAGMVREVLEETALITSPEAWHYLGDMVGEDWRVAVMALVWEGPLTAARSLEAEPIAWHDISSLPEHCLSNLPWLIPLALDRIKHQKFQRFEVRYNE